MKELIALILTAIMVLSLAAWGGGKVAPGESLEVKMTYKLNDKTTPVEINFSSLYEDITDSLTIDLISLK